MANLRNIIMEIETFAGDAVDDHICHGLDVDGDLTDLPTEADYMKLETQLSQQGVSLYETGLTRVFKLAFYHAAKSDFRPTHRIDTPQGRYVVMRTDEGACYTRLEWGAQVRADFHADGSGWTFQGQPFTGQIERLRGPAEPACPCCGAFLNLLDVQVHSVPITTDVSGWDADWSGGERADVSTPRFYVCQNDKCHHLFVGDSVDVWPAKLQDLGTYSWRAVCEALLAAA